MATADRYHQYEVLRREDGSLWELGRGAMGTTFKAFDTNLRFPVALKVINAAYLESDIARQRFLREARAAAALRHPNVASVFNLGTEEDRYFYVMEFIEGETLENRVKRQGPLEPVEALNIGLQVTRALVVTAKHQLVHRDLKPSNLMLVNHEGEQIVKLIDFGLAKGPRDAGDDSGALTIGGFVGTPHFASPEQIEEGEVDIRSDIYSLGLTLYFTLTAQSPFLGSTGQVMSQQLYKPLPIEPLAKLPGCVVSLLRHMTEKDRNNRPQTPQDLQMAILTCLEEIGPARSDFGYPVGGSGGAVDTVDVSSASGQRLGVGAVLAHNYKLIQELAESHIGRSFLADDLSLKRRVDVMLLSADFSSDSRRLTALQEAVRLAGASRHRMLREIYSLEIASDCAFLVQEHVTGPSMLDILRARSVLTAPEVVRLVSLLAPLVDHANLHRLQYLEITLSGVHLTDQSLSRVGAGSDLSQRLLTTWESLEPKVGAINLLLLPSDVQTWSSPATRTQGTPGGGPPDSCIRLLSMLAYELLGGPRTRLEMTGQYTPVATLTQEGNAALRRAVADECPSAKELARQLATATSAVTSAPDFSDDTKPAAQTTDSRISPSQGRAAVSARRRPLAGRWLWALILCAVVFLGIGFYLLTKEIQVQKGTGPEMRLELRESQELPSLSVRTEPAGASILLDGKAPESPANNFTHVPFGTHRLSATLPDYYPLSEEIQIQKGTAPEIRLQLKPVQEVAFLSITAEPAGAAILLDGKPPQSPPNTFTHVPFGTHQLSASLADYEPLKREIQVHKGMASQMQLQLTPKQELAALSITSEPAGASILLDGKPPQEPPETFTHVPFGAHQVVATLNKYQPIKKTIDVRPGMAGKINIELTPRSPDDIEWMNSLDSRGLEEAHKEFSGALEIYRGLADKNPEGYRSDVAKTLNNLAILDSRQGRMEDARQEFAEALQIYRELAQKNQEVYWPLVATTLNNLANADLDRGRLEEAQKEFVEALQIRRQLARKNPENYGPFVARTLNNLAILDRRQNRIEQARSEFEEALQTYRGLAQKSQEVYAPFVAMTLNNLGNLALDQRRLEDARKEFAEALQIRRELAQKNRDVYLPSTVTTLNNLAITDSHLNRLEDARKEFAEALDIYRELADKNPATYRPLLATTLNYLGDVNFRRDRRAEARKEFTEALQIYEILASRDPERFMPKATQLKKLIEQLSDNDKNPGRIKKDQ
jgi:serine/threonine protein kinase/tetratricopeptide (TPR) repeat protein/chaperone required for assembly of F1-ATPase